ncbi:MAG: hypothetical protein A3F84_29460 [Candidatus Handelsmanbacteria bacterium RIFCSPLOWO2_12_FULL_64_10]|uniref:Protein kinase domain-containing protein n=1 Tax=Handelsmanbacteria sp. (strain RIFCSPLOWO2_12_FULL_64_10) TaxID=1817868 RepID=A0A1F6CCD1_HANXR|nr:MAG: hypothetical protein A3F84_29460 [Candidatus Handelsmanbacteria bacterium RIFCSPLOWO2_12_FULL_64_10]
MAIVKGWEVESHLDPFLRGQKKLGSGDEQLARALLTNDLVDVDELLEILVGLTGGDEDIPPVSGTLADLLEERRLAKFNRPEEQVVVESLPAVEIDRLDSPLTALPVLNRGQEVGRYRLEEVLGRGGMGEVWRGHDPVLDRTVAIKFLLGDFSDVGTSLLKESRLAALLEHPNIVPIFDLGELHGYPYVVMRLVDGHPINKHPDRRSLAAFRWIMEACGGIECAHRKGVIHRDIKPGNIMVDTDGRTFVMDFGLARSVFDQDRRDQEAAAEDEPKDEWEDYISTLAALAAEDLGIEADLFESRKSAVVGTPPYMSPEQAMGYRVAFEETGVRHSQVRNIRDERELRQQWGSMGVGPWSDVFSLGATLYELATGSAPFRGQGASDTLRQVLTATPPRPVVPERWFGEVRDRGERCERLSLIIMQCLSKDPAARPELGIVALELENMLRIPMVE